jgi:hypothetical protein
MSFAAIDPILLPWLERHGLHLTREHKEEEVRTTIVVDDSGDIYSVWVGKPDSRGQVRVFAEIEQTVQGRVPHRAQQGLTIDRSVTVPELAIVLEEVYGQIAALISKAHEDSGLSYSTRPNPRLQRTPSAPLSRQPLGASP